MKKQKTVNTVKHNDEFSSGLMEQYGQWMGGDCFQNTDPVDLNLHEEPFAGMDPQSHGAEIEDTTKKKKSAKKESPKAQLDVPGAANEEKEVLEVEEYEIDGQKYILEKIKGADGKACWKGYRYNGTKNGKDDCVKREDSQYGYDSKGNSLNPKDKGKNVKKKALKEEEVEVESRSMNHEGYKSKKIAKIMSYKK